MSSDAKSIPGAKQSAGTVDFIFLFLPFRYPESSIKASGHKLWH